jgi:hypothetical protein
VVCRARCADTKSPSGRSTCYQRRTCQSRRAGSACHFGRDPASAGYVDRRPPGIRVDLTDYFTVTRTVNEFVLVPAAFEALIKKPYFPRRNLPTTHWWSSRLS